MFTDFILSNLLGIVSLCCIIALFFWINSKISVYNNTLNNHHNDDNKRLSALETFLQRGILLDTQDKIAQKYAIEEIDDDNDENNESVNSNIKEIHPYSHNEPINNKINKNNENNENNEVFNKCIENEFDKLINDSIIDVNDNIFKINNIENNEHINNINITEEKYKHKLENNNEVENKNEEKYENKNEEKYENKIENIVENKITDKKPVLKLKLKTK